MRASYVNRLAVACIAVLGCRVDAASGPMDRFSQTFATDRAPASLHARILFRASNGRVHWLQLWRSGDRLLRRDTDGRLTSIVTHKPGDIAYRIDLFDKARKLHTIIDRDSLYQLGTFTDWTGLAYGLQAPKGRYALRPAAVPHPPLPRPPCKWTELAQPGRKTRICWSRADAFPLQIMNSEGKLIWRVTAIDHASPSANTFRIDSAGYTLNNATEEMKRD